MKDSVKLHEVTIGIKMTKPYSCLLEDKNLIIAPQDKGEPPSWIPRFHGERVVWVDRGIFEILKKEIHNKPCLICPYEVKKYCEND